MMPAPPGDNWFQKLHHWRQRHRFGVQLAILILASLVLLLALLQQR